MIDVRVREQHLPQRHAVFVSFTQDAVQVAAGIDDGTFERLRTPDERAVLHDLHQIFVGQRQRMDKNRRGDVQHVLGQALGRFRVDAGVVALDDLEIGEAQKAGARLVVVDPRALAWCLRLVEENPAAELLLDLEAASVLLPMRWGARKLEGAIT